MAALEDSIKSVMEAYEEAHEFAHDCEESYFDPDRFRRSLNAYVQAARNITFRIQSIKSDIPNFDLWYDPWQSYLRSNDLLKWIADARTTVTKRRGLQAHSRARVKTFVSYMDPITQTTDVDPMMPTGLIIGAALGSVPKEYRQYWTVEVSRRWELDDLPGKEVLAGLIEATRMYRAVVNDLLRFLDEGTAPLPAVAVAREPKLDCISDVPELLTTRFDPETGAQIEYDALHIKPDAAALKKAHRTYGEPPEDLARRMQSSDVEEKADAHVEFAQHVLASSGTHFPFIWLRRPNGSWKMVTTQFSGKQSKFTFMHSMAEEVVRESLDALVMVGEAWTAPPSEASGPYPDLSTHPDRGESLVIHAASSDGYLRTTTIEFSRKRNRNPLSRKPDEITFGEPFHTRNPQSVAILWPILRAWGWEIEEATPQFKEPDGGDETVG